MKKSQQTVRIIFQNLKISNFTIFDEKHWSKCIFDCCSHTKKLKLHSIYVAYLIQEPCSSPSLNFLQ